MATKTPTEIGASAAARAKPAVEANPGTQPPASFDLIPGSDFIGRGVYIKPRQPYELKQILLKRESSSGALQTYTRPTTGKTYVVPDGCAVNPSPPLPADQSFGQILIEESWSRFGKQLTLDAGASVSGKSFTIDASAFQANAVKSDEDSYYALRSSFVPLWELYMPNIYDGFSDSLSNELAALVPDDKFAWANREQYAEIFDRYGTHFIKNVWVGGKASLVFTVAKAANLNTNQIRVAVQASILEAAKGSATTEQNTSLETFRKNSSCKVFGSGGDKIALAKLSEFEANAYNTWLDSIEAFPAVIQFGVAGIWTLIKDKAKADALREAYIRESTFVPLTAIVPIGKYFIFLRDSWGFVLDYLESPYESRVKTLSRVRYELTEAAKQWAEETKQKAETLDDKAKGKQLIGIAERYLKEPMPPTGEKLKLENIEQFFPGLQNEPYRAFLRPHAVLSLYELEQPQRAVLFFKYRKCLLVKFCGFLLDETEVEDGYPKDISEVFPGVDVDRVDAALAIPPNKLYIFSGADYYRIEIQPDGTFIPAVKEKILDGWPGVDFERLDTAVYWKNKKVYFFYEDQFIRYDVSNQRADPGYPKYIPSNYVEDWDFFD